VRPFWGFDFLFGRLLQSGSDCRLSLLVKRYFWCVRHHLIGGVGLVMCNGGLYGTMAPVKDSVWFFAHVAVAWLVDLHKLQGLTIQMRLWFFFMSQVLVAVKRSLRNFVKLSLRHFYKLIDSTATLKVPHCQHFMTH
jgi:hypothetical protein